MTWARARPTGGFAVCETCGSELIPQPQLWRHYKNWDQKQHEARLMNWDISKSLKLVKNRAPLHTSSHHVVTRYSRDGCRVTCRMPDPVLHARDHSAPKLILLEMVCTEPPASSVRAAGIARLRALVAFNAYYCIYPGALSSMPRRFLHPGPTLLAVYCHVALAEWSNSPVVCAVA